MKKRFKILMTAVACFWVAGVARADEPYTRYLFAYFNGNSDAQENLFFAVADKDDPYNFTPLNDGKMIMDADTISLSGGLRDPHLYRGEDGWFYMVMTDMKSDNGWSSNRGLILLKSRDLVHWNHSTVHFPTKYAGTTFANAIYVWAPEVIYDSSVDKYLIHFALGTNDGNITYQKLYYAYANSDFTDLEGEPQYMYDRGSATIDMSIIYNETDGLYHGFYKNEGAGGICHATASSLTGTWTEVATGVHQTNTAVEGSEIYRLIDSDTYVLMYDCYSINKMEYCTTTSTMTTFTKASTTANTEIFTPRHGSVIPITDAEYEVLINSMGGIYLASEISIAEAMGVDVASAKAVLNNSSSTSSQLDEAYQSLKLAEETALADYSEDMTSSLGSWTNDNVKSNYGQHWDGTNNSTYSENNSWGSQSWTMSMTQNVSLPAGKYVLRVPARGSSASSPPGERQWRDQSGSK